MTNRKSNLCYYCCSVCGTVAQASLSDVKKVGSPVCPGDCGNEDMDEVTKPEYDRIKAVEDMAILE